MDYKSSFEMIRSLAAAGRTEQDTGYFVAIEQEAKRQLKTFVPVLNKYFDYLVSDDANPSLLKSGRRALEPQLRPMFDDRGATLSYMIYSSDIGVDETAGSIVNGKTKTYVEHLIPEDFTGRVNFDIEGQIKVALHGEPATTTHTKARYVYRTVYEEAKAARPNAQFGFYGVPQAYTWVHPPETAFLKAFNALSGLQFDFISPNIYDTVMEATDTPYRHHAKMVSVRTSMRLARELAEGKDIVPTIWERIDSPASASYQRLIPDWELLRDQVLLAFEEGAAGVAWWGKNARVIKQGSWSSWFDCRGMNRLQAEKYLLTDLPSRLATLFLDACETWTPAPVVGPIMR